MAQHQHPHYHFDQIPSDLSSQRTLVPRKDILRKPHRILPKLLPIFRLDEVVRMSFYPLQKNIAHTQLDRQPEMVVGCECGLAIPGRVVPLD